MKFPLATIFLMLSYGISSQAEAPPPTSHPTTAPTSAPAAPALIQVRALDVRDPSHFFGDASLRKVNDAVERIHQRFNKQLLIETYPAIPDDQKARFEKMSKPEFFKEWLSARAKIREADGVFILICKEPGRIQIAAGAHTRERIFTQKDVDELNQLMSVQFRAHNYDQGLEQAAKFVEDRMDSNLRK